MATTINKQKVLNQLLSSIGTMGEAEQEARPILQEFIYGLCRENATTEQADRAFNNLTRRSW